MRSKRKTEGQLRRLSDTHMHILSLFFLGNTQTDIAQVLDTSITVVQRVIHSEMGQEILTAMRTKALLEDTPDIKQSFQKMLVENMELPATMLKGYVESPIIGDDGEISKIVKQRIDPQLRLKAFQTVADLAGVSTDKNQQPNILILHNIETLEEIKRGARQRKLQSVEDIPYEEVS